MEKNPSRITRWWPALIIILCCIIIWRCWFITPPLTTVILVRHADRTGTVDQINSIGLIRADELDRILDKVEINAIYTSTALRTQQTVEEISTTLGITPIIYDPSNIPNLASDILTGFKGKIVLVSGHSNTIPQTINELGYIPSLVDIPHNEYDRIYILEIVGNKATRLLEMEYGNDTN